MLVKIIVLSMILERIWENLQQLKLDHMKQIDMPDKLKIIMDNDTLHGITNASKDLKATTKVKYPIPVYIVPSRSVISDKFDNKIEIITFADFKKVISDMNYNDIVSNQFKACLSEWAGNEAGKPVKKINQESN